MLFIIWYHVKACVRDIRARNLGMAIEAETRRGGQVFISNGRQEWRLR